jgi:hypothetical protein
MARVNPTLSAKFRRPEKQLGPGHGLAWNVRVKPGVSSAHIDRPRSGTVSFALSICNGCRIEVKSKLPFLGILEGVG